MTAYDFAALASLALTPLALILSVHVVIAWAPAFIEALRAPRPLAARDLFILGVVVAFTGEILDGVWWGAGWSTEYVSGEVTAPALGFFRRNGAIANAVFRQGATIAAALLHLRSARQPVARIALVSAALSLAYVAALVALRMSQ